MPSFNDYKIWCWNSWSDFHGFDPTWGKSDFVNLKRIWEICGDSEARKVWTTYLRNTDKFYQKKSPNMLMHGLDRFRLDARKLEGSINTTPREPAADQSLIDEAQQLYLESDIPWDDAVRAAIRNRNAKRVATPQQQEQFKQRGV